jgi:hypothetical protein
VAGGWRVGDLEPVGKGYHEALALVSSAETSLHVDVFFIGPGSSHFSVLLMGLLHIALKNEINISTSLPARCK